MLMVGFRGGASGPGCAAGRHGRQP